ncbi:MAG TPA: phosphotransferase, partial [Methanomicrobiales archaeon]|nr:phosphotransferase [Methanomicrobiales archaeon]
RTGGTDGHLLHDICGVATCSHAGSVEEFLDAILLKENIVIGREKTIIQKVITGTAMLPHHIPYAPSILHARWEQRLSLRERNRR